MKISFKQITDKTWYPFALTFLIAGTAVSLFGLIYYNLSGDKFDWMGFHTESLGMVLDIIFLGIVWAIIDSFRKSRNDIKRYKEEIADYSQWEGDEAKYRVRGLIWRLIGKGEYDFNISYCYLVNADLYGIKCTGDARGANFSKANLGEADIQNIDLSFANFKYANLSYALLCGSDVSTAKFKGANLYKADFRGCKNIYRASFWGAKYIWEAKFDKDVDLNKLKRQDDYIEVLLKNDHPDKYFKYIEDKCNCVVIDYEHDEQDVNIVRYHITKEYMKNNDNLLNIEEEKEHYFVVTLNNENINHD